ncbi:unnamed protein product [Zymoseptoria tritici ST99CH_3D1]|nr:unnamed protein product [Zymoseptoria tritici ST99CH_3D1]
MRYSLSSILIATAQFAITAKALPKPAILRRATYSVVDVGGPASQTFAPLPYETVVYTKPPKSDAATISAVVPATPASDGARGESTDSTSCDIFNNAFNNRFDNFFDHLFDDLADHLVAHVFNDHIADFLDDLSNSHFNYLLEDFNRNFDDDPIDHDYRFDVRSCDGICNYNCEEYYNAALRVINHECDNVSCNNNMVDRGPDHAGFDGGDYNNGNKLGDAGGGHNTIRYTTSKLHVYCMVERSKYGCRPSVGHVADQRDKHYNPWRIRNAYCAVEFHPRSDFSTNLGACSVGYGGVVESFS